MDSDYHVSVPGLKPSIQGIAMRNIYELSTSEAHRIVTEELHCELPPLDAVENEDWGRDYVLQHFQRVSSDELAALGLTWEGEK